MRSNWKLFGAICALLAAGTIAAYWSVWSCDFISLDDGEYVYKNRRVLSGLSWTGWQYAWTSLDASNWHPLTWLTLEADGSLWGSNPSGYHATNLVLHTLNSLLLFVVMSQMTDRLTLSACVAGFFAVHPLHVESVAWISERKDVLCTLFLLLTIAAYIRYASRPSMLRYLLVIMLFVLGLLAKPMLVTLPILLLLLDVWPLERVAGPRSSIYRERYPQRTLRMLIVEKLPLLVLAFADGLTTVAAQFGAVKLMTDVPWGTRVANMFNAYAWYLEKTFVPIHLTIFYPHPERELPWSRVLFGLVLFCLISAWAFRRTRDKPYLAFGWAWFVISLLPVIGLIQVGLQAYADRYAYIPHIGLFVAIVWEAESFFVKTKSRRILGGLLALSTLAACGVLTHLQIGYWQNNDTMWSHAIALNPNNGFAHAHLSDYLFDRGDYEKAIVHIETGLRFRRSGYASNAYANWGISLLALNRPEEAEQKFRAALELDQNHEKALRELEKLLSAQGRQSEAAEVSARHEQALDRLFEKQRQEVKEQFRLGFMRAREGNVKQAAVHFEKAVELVPKSAEAHINLAVTQRQLNRDNEAKSHFLRAIELNPELANAHSQLAAILESEKDLSGAKKHLAEVLRITPNDVKAKERLQRLSNP